MFEKKEIKKSAIFLLIFVSFNIASAVQIIYVDDDGPADFNNIQAAINDANDGDTVLVADGTYTGNGNRDIDFFGKAITVKSENGPETCIIDCQASEQDLHRGFDFHSREGNDSVLDGFTIINGRAYSGGAIKCEIYSSPIIKNCIIRDNIALSYEYPLPTVTNGGGIACFDNNSIILNCKFFNNVASGTGGAVYFGGSYPIYRTNAVIQNCEFKQNNATCGGAIGFIYSDIALHNCVISGNIATSVSNYGGGGIFVQGGNLMIVNSTIVGNRTTTSEGGGGIFMVSGYANIKNSLILNNMALHSREIGLHGPSNIFLEICYSNIQGGIEEMPTNSYPSLNWGVGNVDIDPLFVNQGYWVDDNDPNIIVEQYDPNDPNIIWIDGDYHLKSQAGRWDADTQSWVIDDVTSPCIDAGDPMSPIGLEPFPNGGYINMGAYGGTEQASKSYFGEPLCETIVAGDINGDCKVDFADVVILLLHWLEEY